MLKKITICIFLILTLSAFDFQPLDEKTAQEKLPQSKHEFWDKISKCKIKFDEKSGKFETKFTDDIKNLDGKEIITSGFMLPLDETIKQKNFILSKKTPTCPFCLPGEPTEFILVKTDKPIKFTDDLISIKGNFYLINDTEKAIFFEIRNAEKIKN